MSSRIRHSTARPPGRRQSLAPTPSRASSSNRNADSLPAYKKPSHPLDGEATRELRSLQERNLNDIKRHNKQATEHITNTAASVNDMLRNHAEYMSRRQKKWDAGKSLEDKEDDERIMAELQANVDEATIKLEESMRAVIDSDVAAQRIEEALEWLRSNAPARLAEEYETQMTQRETQRQTQTQAASQRAHARDGDDGEMDDGPTPGPTPLDGSRIALTGVSELFATRIQREKDDYTSRSHTARYARNNDYRDFKRTVHDAKFGDDGPVLGHEDTWFTESGSPAPGITNTTQRGEFDDEDDIVMDRATVSTRCPITYQQFKEPYSSNKCPHTFEKNAILDMIRKGPHRVDGQKAVECPVNGCDKMLTLNDVRTDTILVRKIKRMQQAELEGDDSDDDVQAPRRESQQTDGSDDDMPDAPSRLQAPGTQQPPQSSVIEDLGDPSDSEMST
ncbi:E3 SUMO-protein ligase NSE2 [Alternaria panax]|uniref:E3 SUMO-protein ligase NSE2 n=1 Tax=Alternaria panax TaxID=48097 RepID=A0AAD4FH81_9PLEO|nr:E3 SUMO-protein ligase NSE2 [Alternaria panax]